MGKQEPVKNKFVIHLNSDEKAYVQCSKLRVGNSGELDMINSIWTFMQTFERTVGSFSAGQWVYWESVENDRE